MAFVQTLIDGAVSAGFFAELSGLVIGSDNLPHVSYYDNINGDLKYGHFNGLTWDLQVVDNVNDCGRGSSIDLDSNGYPWISYYSDDFNSIKIARWDGSIWVKNFVFFGTTLFDTSIKIDKALSKAWIVFGRFNPSPILYGSFGVDAIWSTITIDTLGSNAGTRPRLSLTPSNHPRVISETVISGSSRLRFTQWDGLGWLPTDYVSLTELNTRNADIIADQFGSSHISYNLNNTEIKYGIYNGVSWILETIFTGNATQTRIHLDLNGIPWVSYYDNTSSRLKITNRIGGVWSAPVDVSTNPLLSGGLEFLFSPEGHRYIVTYGSYNQLLELSPPTFNVLDVRDFTYNSVDIRAEANQNCTAYLVVLPDGAPAPTSLQVKNGQDSFSVSVPVGFSDSDVLIANFENSAGVFVGVNLQQVTSYDCYVVCEGIAGLQASPTLLEFTTLAIVSSPISGPTVAECNNVLNITLFGRPSIPYYTSLVATFGYCVFALPVDNTISNHAEIALSLLAEQFK